MQLGRKNFVFHRLDICDYEKFKTKVGKVNLILHEAAAKKVSEDQTAKPTLRVNVLGTEAVLRLARHHRPPMTKQATRHR